MADRSRRALLGALLGLIVAAEDLRGEGPEDPFAVCAQRFRAQPDDYEASYCFFEVARQRRQWHEAAVRLEKLLARRPQNPWPRLTLAHVQAQLDPARAEATYRAVADGFRRQGLAAGEVLARTNLYNLLIDRGEEERAAAEVARVIEVAAAAGDSIVKARALILEAEHLRDRGGDLETVCRLLRRAEPLVFAGGPYRLQRVCLLGLGSACFRLGRYGEARRHYRRLEELARSAGDDYGRALFAYNQANTLLAESFELPTTGSRERLLATFQGALAAAEGAGHRSTEMLSQRLLGELLSRFEPSRGTALAHFERSVELARELSQPGKLAAGLRSLGGHLARWGELRRAAALLDEGLALAREAGDDQEVARALDTRMRVSWEQGTRSRALADTSAALDALEAMRDHQVSASGRADLFAAWSDVYYWPAGRLLGEGEPPREDLELAFSLAERLRARVLLEAMMKARTEPPVDGARGFATLAQVEAALGDDEALLSFQIALWRDVYGDFGGGSWLLASTRRGTRVYRLPDRVALRPAVRLFNGLFDHRDGSEARAAALLHRDLLAAALADLPPTVRRLVIVPDGDLHLLPFAALRAERDAEPLGRGFELSEAPSATLWLRWRRAPTARRSAAVLVLADAPVDGARLGALPHAREEGRAVVGRLGRGSRLLVGAEASEHRLKSTPLEPFAVLHFATHAVIDPEHPERSAILLASGTAGEDGLLQPGDVVGLDLAGKVVVLSACQSASGAVLRGEGVLSLARAFFEAGAHAVVGSLWPLRDDEAAALVERFYEHLAAGESVAGALAAAQDERRRAGAPAAAWAGFVVLGDGGAVPFRAEKSFVSHVALGLGLAAVFAGFALVGAWRKFHARS